MNFYKGQQAVLATMHGKEKAISKSLESELGLKILVTNNLDTNKFGTFTGTKKRKGSQLEAAVAKAKAALQHSKLNIAISSEGSFGANTSFSIIPTNIELVLFLDPSNNLLVKGLHSSHDIMLKGQYANSSEQALEIAKEYNFPNHGIVLKKKENSRKILTESLQNIQELEQYLQKYFKKPFTKKIYIETDMRAHRNPTRMKNISLAAKDLVAKLKTKCPNCSLPGFGLNGYEYGLECQLCNAPTGQKKIAIHQCSACNHQEKLLINLETKADPRYCNFCNP
jgi:hypothetical protein